MNGQPGSDGLLGSERVRGPAPAREGPRLHYLPRLPREYYQGDAVVHWTQTTFDRVKGWLNQRFHARFRELMLHVAVREGLFCPIYCLMPDHIHLIWMGLHLTTDQLRAMSFLRTYLEPELAPLKFQHQAEDNVLREKERKQASRRLLQGLIESVRHVKRCARWRVRAPSIRPA